MKNIILIGYMGSGKSTIGKVLARELNINFIDFDDFLQMKEKRSIKEIFDLKGEIYFRNLEQKYLQEVLKSAPQSVISMGGGTPCYGDNMSLITNSNTTSIYIKVTVEELAVRLFKARAERPLLIHQDTPEKMDEFVRKHLFERSFYYNQAELKVLVDGRTPLEVAQEIKARLF
ncbi:shikimate kinase [Flavimarina sp. Hel_I_48]|uniref:shikimate kinase n=1 Tax=Flavimarina sp. Hel_I_48 TaxID=1392488 RepID=UPI0004DF3CD0|nr:shikimate kinase [Flavimarina sp. Hel_I_48]